LENKQFAKELEQRTREFAVRIIKLSMNLPDSPESRAIRNQITKSGTSIGANYREANPSRSKADFKNKIKICESEAGYWLEIIANLNQVDSERIKSASAESNELIAIFTSISKNLKL